MKDVQSERTRLRRCTVASVSLLLLVLNLSACQREPAPTGSEPAKATEEPGSSQSPAVSTIAAVRRADLLSAAALAADEVAAGNPLPKSNLELTDRTFELRIPFGCDDGISGRWGEWTVDPKTRVLRIRVRPERWTDDPTFRQLASGMAYDTAEGFWIERAWTRSEQCPPNPRPDLAPPASPAAHSSAESVPPPVPARTFALVQYFSPDAPRNLRQGSRPYSYTAKLPKAETAIPTGFRMKLIGRISGFSDGQPIHCLNGSPAQQPTCAAAVEFARVILEDAETGETLTEWSD